MLCGRHYHGQATNIDHMTLCVKNLAAAEYLFTKILGFDVIWSARDVGSDKSSMDTVVVQRGDAKIALMQGRNKEVKSQICEFIDKYGEGVQHIAIEVDDIDAVSREWEAHGSKIQRESQGWTGWVRSVKAAIHLSTIPRMRRLSWNSRNASMARNSRRPLFARRSNPSIRTLNVIRSHMLRRPSSTMRRFRFRLKMVPQA